MGSERGEIAAPAHPRWWWLFRVPGAVSYVFRHHAGTAVSAAGSVVAFGAALIATGLVESGTDARHPTPLDNAWVQAGAVIMIVGVVFSLLVLVTLVARRVREESHRAHVVSRQLSGEVLLTSLTKPLADAGKKINEFNIETEDLLRRIDPTSGLLARYWSNAGMPPIKRGGFDLDQYEMAQHMTNRIGRLNEIIAELER
jgi:hypothetical protein